MLLGEGTLMLRAASGDLTFPLAANFEIFGPDTLMVNRNAAVWLDADRRVFLAAELLPDLDALGPTLNAPAQPQPTGETRSFGPLTMITRAGWGAADPDMNAAEEHGVFDAQSNPEGWLVYPGSLADWLNTIVVHHTALAFTEGPREIQVAHIRTSGYADIAYHFLIDSFGTLYEGRSLGVRGSHTGGHNTGTVGIALIGNFQLIPALQIQMISLTALVKTLAEQVPITHLAGHRDFQPGETECPGSNLEALLPGLAADVGLQYGTGGYVPPPWATP